MTALNTRKFPNLPFSTVQIPQQSGVYHMSRLPVDTPEHDASESGNLDPRA